MVDGEAVSGLEALAETLRTMSPGDRLRLAAGLVDERKPKALRVAVAIMQVALDEARLVLALTGEGAS